MSGAKTPVSNSGKKTSAKKKAQLKKTSFSDVGGLAAQVKQLEELTGLLKDGPVRDLARGLGIGPRLPRGVLLYGPPGTGKSLLARAAICESGVHSSPISTLEALTTQSTSSSNGTGDVEGHLFRVFAEAKDKAPYIIFIDDLETICPKYDTGHMTFQESKAVGTLVNLIDSLSDTDAPVLIIATCSRPDAIHHSLRRTGRFDKEIEISVPQSLERNEILEVILRNIKHSLSGEEISSISGRLHGFVGADVSALCSEAGLRALRRFSENRENFGDFSDFFVTFDDFLKSLPFVKPSALREVQLEVPQVRWQDIGGQEVTKLKFRQSVEWPLKYGEKFQLLGIRPPRGILLFGPPGCSKTLMARALATEGGINFLAIKGPELYNKYVGESERALREIFHRARKSAPSIIFIDEIDALSSARGGGAKSGNSVGDRILATLLNEMDGIECLQEVIVVGATNRPEVIDKALMRPGRLDRIIYVPLPDDKTRGEILSIRFRKTPTAVDVDKDVLVKRTEGFSGAEITAVCQEAALAALEEDLDSVEVSMRHFERALSSVKPRTTTETVRCYNDFYEKNALDSSG